MNSPQRLVFLAALAAAALVGARAGGTPAPQYNPTYGPSPSNLYYHFGYTTGSLLADWGFDGNGGGAGTTFADSSGNGNTGTLEGTDTVTSMAAKGYLAAPVGGGLYFNGATGTGNYIGVPYNSQFGGMNDLTVSAWVYFPSGFTASSITQKSDIFSLWNQNGGNQAWQFGFGYIAAPLSWMTYSIAGDYNNYGQYYWTANSAGTQGPTATPGQWQLLTYTYDGGSSSTAAGLFSMAADGVVFAAGETNPGGYPAQRPLPQAAVGQMLELAGGNNGWLGGLADLAIWNCALSGTDSTGPTGYTPTWNKAAGETAALYNTPIYGTTAGHGTAMNAYGAAAMNQLFTVYAQQDLATATAVATASGTLDWTYVASGLTAGSGVAGQLADGMYFVQLDSAGGGVETVLPGDANLDGQVDVNDLTIVLSHFGQTGMSWAQGEFTGDGTVDVNDLTIVLSHFGQTLGLPAAGAAAVPEPACAVLLAIGAITLLAFAKRRQA
jgi:hypothetical protein